MKYYELTFQIEPQSEVAQDVLSALLADIGFETFMPMEDGTLKAYVQQDFYDEESLHGLLEAFPLPDTRIHYDIIEPEDKDWNETWEAEGFEPIHIDNRLVICDTHHDTTHDDSNARRILIHPRQAFGTGSHQTTRMILAQLLDMQLEGLSIVDAGCGTGILGFLSLMQGAKHVVAYDIDEWSVQNTLDNAALNFGPHDIEERLEVRLGDASAIDGETGHDLLIANINRNILLGDFARFSSATRQQGAHILLSGFYKDDVPYLLDEAAKHGFTLEKQCCDEEWTMLLLKR